MSSQQSEWFKSSYSNQNGECVETRRAATGMDLRDSKDPHGPTLAFPAPAWRTFVASVRAGDFAADS
ncbi:DUF397 domain-containing protein [Kitasatospora sp. MAA4]|uniref:DUF397 domain-containing protein n=1 Tax=Kitasatospora sp. MAA4 TaxID=3035093 RepID=UPI0024753054|nr:DUF397 domain-containing protein [Kitasatospora sp. MAA4]